MKIYILEGFSMEPYDGATWPEKAFKDKATAETFLKSQKGLVFDQNLKAYDCGWAYSNHIVELELI